jgi:branched-chain amino acid transport system substrate-binding protein
MFSRNRIPVFALACLGAVAAVSGGARAQETIKFGVSAPTSGPAAIWGKGQSWMCSKAADEIKQAGGIKVKGKVYNIECVTYDNKYNAAEATKVAQTLVNRDGVKFMYVSGTAAVLATQSLTERQGLVVFSSAWGKALKGPNLPFTFNTVSTPYEITPSLIKFITKTAPDAKSVVLLNVSDATGKEAEAAGRPMWEKAGIKVLSSDFYERGTTEFQPIANRIMSFHPDIVDLASLPMSEAGRVFKELDVLGYKGIKVADSGASAEGLMATSGAAGNGTYMGSAVPFDSPTTTEHQIKVNNEAHALLGENLGGAMISCYDPIYALKAAMEYAQSTDPKDVANALRLVKFNTFFGGQAHFGGKALYGIEAQEMMPVYITQVEGGKLVQKGQIAPAE